MNKAHVIEITKACTVAFMKARNSLVVHCRKKQTTGEQNIGNVMRNVGNSMREKCKSKQKFGTAKICKAE